MVDLGVPPDIENYDLYPVDGFKVYVKKDVIVELPVLSFRLEKFLFMKNIVVEGIKIEV